MFRTLRSSMLRTLPVVACFALLATSSFAQTTLRWQFKQGQVLNQVMEQDMKIAMKVGDQDVNNHITQTMDLTWKVSEIDAEGVATVVQEFTRVRMKMDMPGGMGFEFDSDKEEELAGIGAVIAPVLKALAESKFTMKMTNRGEIRDVEMTGKMEEALKKLPGAGGMGGMFSKNGLIKTVEQATHAFPKGPVKKGDTWTSNALVDMPRMGKMASETKLTYAGPEVVEGKPLEKMDLAVTTKMVPKEGEAALMAMTIKDQETTGYLAFDNVAGRLSHSELFNKMTMQIAIGENTINQKIEQTVKVRVTPAK